MYDEGDELRKRAALFDVYWEPVSILMELAPKLIFALYIYLGNEIDLATTVLLMD